MKSRKKLPIFCEECAWKNEQFQGITPCEVCIRNPKLMSQRVQDVKINIQNQEIKVPRDFYISAEMLEIFKLLLAKAQREIELLKLSQTRNAYMPTIKYTWYPIGNITYPSSGTSVTWRWSYHSTASNTSTSNTSSTN